MNKTVLSIPKALYWPVATILLFGLVLTARTVVGGASINGKFAGWMGLLACATALSGLTLIRFRGSTRHKAVLPIHVTLFAVALLGFMFVDLTPASSTLPRAEREASTASQRHQRLPIEGTWKGAGTCIDHDGLLGARRSQRPSVIKTTGVFVIRSRGASVLGLETNDKGLSINAKIEPILKIGLGVGTTENLQPNNTGAYTSHVVFKGGFPAPEIERMAERLRGNPPPELSDDVEWDTTLETFGNTAKLRFVMSSLRFGTRRLSSQREIAYSLEKTSDEVPDLFATPPPPPAHVSTEGEAK